MAFVLHTIVIGMLLKLASDSSVSWWEGDVSSFHHFESAVASAFNVIGLNAISLRCFLRCPDFFIVEWSGVPGVWISNHYNSATLAKAWRKLSDYYLCMCDVFDAIEKQDIKIVEGYKELPEVRTQAKVVTLRFNR